MACSAKVERGCQANACAGSGDEYRREAGSVLATSEDGGATWTPQLILPGEDAREGALIFTNQKMGVLRAGAKMFRTTDGGQTWTGAIGQIGGKPDVKWVWHRLRHAA